MAKSLKDFFLKFVSVVDKGDNPEAKILLFKSAEEDLDKAVWTTAYMNDLPDSAFLYIESGGEKKDGKTQGNKRHFPYKNAEGKIDLPHLRNAIARIPQANVPQDVKDRCQARARRLLGELNKMIEGGVVMKTFEELIKELSKEDAKLVTDELKVKDEKIGELEKNQKEPAKKVEPSDEELLKSVDPKIRELVEKAQKDTKEAKEKADKLEKANKEKEDELKKEALSKEAEKLGNIGATKEELVEIFTKVEPEILEKIKAVLTADNTALEGNALIKAVGSDKDLGDKKAIDEIEEKAEELRKVEPKLTKEQARTKVLKENPDLYKKYIEE